MSFSALRTTAKPTRQAAGYKSMGGRERCGLCRHFVPASACNRIVGPVSAVGWCRYFSQELHVQTYTSPQGAMGASNPPSLDLTFADGSGVLDPRITFTRASTATYFDSSGVMRTAASNAPRFDYDPVTRALRGLLIEEARTNASFPSIPGAGWSTTAGTITASATAAPDGTTSGVQFKEDATANSHAVTVPMTGLVTSTQYTTSFYAKPSGRGFVYVTGVGLNGAGLQPQWNITAGTDISVGTNANFYHGIQSVGNGWYRCWFSWLWPNLTALAIFPELTANGGSVYQGDNVSGFYIWGAQIEIGTFPTSYIPTTAAAVTRAVDVASMPWVTSGSFSHMLEGMGHSSSSAAAFMCLDDGTGSNLTQYYVPGNGNTHYQMIPGSDIVVGNIGAAGTLTVYKVASTYAPNLQTGALNGVLGTSATFATLPAPSTTLRFGSQVGGSLQHTGYIRRVQYWSRVLSNAEMQSVTT